MSAYFEAVVLRAAWRPLAQALEALDDPDDPAYELRPVTLRARRVTRQGYVVFGWRAGRRRPECAGEVEDLAEELSARLGVPAVAVHYDDQVGPVKTALLVRDGEPVRYYGPADEVWVPYGPGGRLVLDGPRYTGETAPDDVECDCIRGGIDAALEAAGFARWATLERLYDVACDWDGEAYPLVWERPGVPPGPRRSPGRTGY